MCALLLLILLVADNLCQLQAMCNKTGSVFKSKDTLQVVVDDYLLNKDEVTSVYGSINCWDVSAITDMSYLFSMKTTMDENISCWDVSNVTQMDYMFHGASSFNQDIGKWNVSKVESMTAMFYLASSFNQDLSSWNTRKVKDFSYMFNGASKFKQNLCDWFNNFNSNSSPLAHSMLTYSGCIFQVDPSFATKERLCQKCEPPDERRGMFF